ncbi:MAG TPA: magnesium transporter [Tepidisphaeraceae bacterium]|nr:magnesium transporter [Tepidisphaeraceae bacterium]
MSAETTKRKKNGNQPLLAEVEQKALDDFLADQPRQIASQVEEMPPADGAEVIQNLPSAEAADVAEYLDPNTAAGILARMEPQQAASVVSDMETPEAAVMLGAMNPDDRVDILEHIPKEKHEALMLEMDAPQVAEVRQLEQYPPETAGGIMTTQVTALYEYITVENAISLLRRLNEELEQMFYVYVIDRRQHLVGVLSMRDLILAKPEKPLREIMIQSVRSVPATMDREAVAKFMRKYGYLAVPVVDQQNKLVGLITLDDVIDIIEQETTEDVQRMFGAGAEERLASPWQFSFKKRVGWLQVNLGTAFLAAGIVSLFTKTIEAVPILAAYQTIVSGMGGNAGAQAMAVSIRGIAVGESARVSIQRVLKREFMVGLMSGIVIGITTGLIATIFNYSHHGFLLGLIICAALMINHVNACVTGVCVPFVMKRLGFDPAQSATIFATTFTDCGGFFACLGLAKVCMPWLVG